LRGSRAVEFPDHSFRGRRVHVTGDQYLTGSRINLEPDHPGQIPQPAAEAPQARVAQALWEREDMMFRGCRHAVTVTGPAVQSLSSDRRQTIDRGLSPAAGFDRALPFGACADGDLVDEVGGVVGDEPEQR
jgi:hypothetical protein